MPINYQDGKIYKLTGGGLTYYGSTCQSLCKRLANHRGVKKHFDNGKTTEKVSSFQVLEMPDCDICLVENYPCNSKEELHMRERWYIENNECINKHLPIRTQFEKENHDKIRGQTENRKQWKQDYEMTPQRKKWVSEYEATEKRKAAKKIANAKYEEKNKGRHQTDEYKERRRLYQQTDEYKERRKLYHAARYARKKKERAEAAVNVDV